MGWWKVKGTEDIVGDDAYAILRDAAKTVVGLYQSAHGRRPRRSEWERLMRDALEPVNGAQSMFDVDIRPERLVIEACPFVPQPDEPLEP